MKTGMVLNPGVKETGRVLDPGAGETRRLLDPGVGETGDLGLGLGLAALEYGVL
jgi:hypothetical protein